jgi:hypothetical protein
MKTAGLILFWIILMACLTAPAEGYPEHIAADLTEMGFHSYEDWREHYLHYADTRAAAALTTTSSR